MSMLEFQKVLLSLYTEEAFLDGFLADPHFLRGRDLTERERAALMHIPEKKLHELAHQLRRKRLDMLRRVSSKPGAVASVFIAPSYRSGPTLFLVDSTPETEVPLAVGVYQLLREVALFEKIFSVASLVSAGKRLLVRARGIQAEQPTVADFISVCSLAVKHRLWGKVICRFL